MHSRFNVRPWSMLLVAIGLTACVEEEVGEVGEPADELEVVEPAAAAADQLQAENPEQLVGGDPIVACTSVNVIGELSVNADCSNQMLALPPDWDVHGLFISHNPELGHWTEPRTQAMRQFCVFEWVGQEPVTLEDYEPLFDAIENSSVMDLETVEVDCLGQATMGSGLDTAAVHEALAGRYHKAIEWVSATQLGGSQANRVFPKIAILDTVSQQAHDNPQIDPINMHGEFMGDIVADVACPDHDDECLKYINYHVAMPREAYSAADYVVGGQHGTMGDLATAVVAAVGTWREERIADPTETPRLVLSLSLGWDPSLNAPTRAPYRALELALKFASCNGAIVVASSGNVADPKCPVDTGPLAPATFEEVAAPTAQECAQLGFLPLDPNQYPVFDVPRPLVYAVGGIDGERPIVNARPDSTPPLVSFASNVTVASVQGGYTLPLTGTSVSAASVAAIAGLMWSYSPESTPSQIMTTIATSGHLSSMTADFGFGGYSGNVRQVSACLALEDICTGRPGCPTLNCQQQTGYDLAHAIDDAINDPSNTLASHVGGNPVQVQCGWSEWDEQTDPQPEHPICPSCSITSPDDEEKSNDELSMTIKAEYQGLVDGITFTTVAANGTRTVFVFDAAIIESVNSPAINITQVTMEAPGTVSANLSFHLVDGSTQDGPIVVNPD
jgi:hypothetical protein